MKFAFSLRFVAWIDRSAARVEPEICEKSTAQVLQEVI
jgi:hypothetical protein